MSNWFTRIIRPPTLGYAEDGGNPSLVKSGGGTENIYEWYVDGDGNEWKRNKVTGASAKTGNKFPVKAAAQDTPEIEYDANGKAFRWTTLNGQPVTAFLGSQFDRADKAAGYRAPAATPAPRYPTSGVTPTGQSYTVDPYTAAITLGPVYGELATSRSPQQLRQDVLDDIASQRAYTDKQTADSQRYNTGERLGGQTFTSGENAANRTFQTGERLGGQAFQAGENQLGRMFQSGESTLDRQFQSGESSINRQFTSGESAIDRAQRAGEFAANYSITRAQAQRQDREAALNAARTYTELTASPDLTGFQRFLSAGGGSVGNALQRGATSLTREGQLGGARALQVAEQPLPTYADYNYVPQANPYAGLTNQFAGASNPYAGRGNPAVGAAPTAAAAPVVMPTVMPTAQQNLGAHVVPTAANSSNFVDRPTTAAETAAWQAGITGAPDFVTRYAQGTQEVPVGEGTQFISGDDASADPMANGADPEAVTINDPTGDATFSVDPLEQPGSPEPGGGRSAELSALLGALSRFLASGEAPPPMPEMPRYAFGTGIMPEDDPYVDRVMAQRQATPYSLNTQSASYFNDSPTLRSINEMGAQVATGVPMAEFGWEANRLRPGMLSRDSLNLGQ